MDILVKNMKITTTQQRLHYGTLSKNTYTMIGSISSNVPFTVQFQCDGIIKDIPKTILDNTISFAPVDFIYPSFETDETQDFQIILEGGDEYRVDLQLYEPYPITTLAPGGT